MNYFLIKEFIQYYHLKTDEHSLHSPFFFDFYTKLVKASAYLAEWSTLEQERKSLLKNTNKIIRTDLGAGSKVNHSKQLTIAEIAKNSLSTPKFSQFLFRLIEHYQSQNIIELGTSLGINCAYMASANPNPIVNSFEGDPALVEIAKQINQHKKVQFHLGNIDQTLAEFLIIFNQKIDLVYADANHTYEASINYYQLIQPHLHQNSIYIIDDIHWSSAMKKAWDELKNYPEVSSSIDLFDAGILFFNKDFQNQHYILDF